MEDGASVLKIAELIKRGKICGFTTTNQKGQLTSRPMTLQQTAFDGTLWFFTKKSSTKCQEIALNQNINVLFNAGDDWVSLSGQAESIDDPQMKQYLWNPLFKAWFPDGLEDPDLTLIRVKVDSAEYWDSANKITQLIGMVKSAVTGEEADVGDNKTVQIT